MIERTLGNILTDDSEALVNMPVGTARPKMTVARALLIKLMKHMHDLLTGRHSWKYRSLPIFFRNRAWI